MLRFKTWLLPLMIMLTLLSACSDHDEASPYTVTEVQLSAEATTFPDGTTQTIEAKAIYLNGESTGASSHNSEWSTEDPTIATVNAEGEVTGVSPGTTLIYATYLGGEPAVTGSLSVTITEAEITSIEIFPSEVELILGLNITYQAYATYSNDMGDYLENSDDLVWSTDNAGVVNIDSKTGTITTIDEGNSTITATYKGLLTDEATLYVVQANDINIAIYPVDGNEVIDGYPIDFYAEASYQTKKGTATTDVTHLVDWHSTEPEFLTVSDIKGRFIGAGEGSSIVSATFDDALIDFPVTINDSNSRIVYVNHGTIESISIQDNPETLPIGLNQKMTIVGNYSGDNVEDISETVAVTWKSNNANATVNQYGVVQGQKEGDVTITASVDGSDIVDSKTITITAAEWAGKIRVTPNKNYVAAGEKTQFIAKAIYTDETEHSIPEGSNITWDVIEKRDDTLTIPFDDGVQISSEGLLENFSTNTRPVEIDVIVTANTYHNTYTTLGAIKLLNTYTDSADLSFVGPLTNSEYELSSAYGDNEETAVYEEDGVTGPEGTSFVVSTFSEALNICDALIYNKYDDYRLPTFDELQTVWSTFDGNSEAPYSLYADHKWSVGKSFWTSTVVTEATETSGTIYKLVDLREGNDELSADGLPENFSGYNYISCVREK